MNPVEPEPKLGRVNWARGVRIPAILDTDSNRKCIAQRNLRQLAIF